MYLRISVGHNVAHSHTFKFMIHLWAIYFIWIDWGNAWRFVEVRMLYFQPTCRAGKPDGLLRMSIHARSHSDRTGASTATEEAPLGGGVGSQREAAWSCRDGPLLWIFLSGSACSLQSVGRQISGQAFLNLSKYLSNKIIKSKT